LEWALKHVNRFYSSDFFPKAFEFEAITSQWPKVRDYILNLDLTAYAPKAPRQLLAPKANGTFRVVHQLEPIDSLIYTALVYEVSRDIENNRVSAADGIACSYRIIPDVSGSFFAGTSEGCDLFTGRTDSLAERIPMDSF
jgi:hypothetical protein